MSVENEIDELMLLFPREYERMQGHFLGEAWADREVPVPPTWVKQRVRTPPGCENACLSAEIANIYPEAVRSVLVDYVKEWARVRQYGYHLMIFGTGGATYKRRQWAASAVINEIIMRFGQTQDIGMDWVTPDNIRQILSLKKERFDAYSSLRAKVQTTKLLVIENPIRVSPYSEEGYFISDLYKARADRLLPTISLLRGDPEDREFKNIEIALGEDVSDTFRLYAKYITSL